MSSEIYQCIVLPKGFEAEDRLRVTITVAPKPDVDHWFNLPNELLAWSEIQLILTSNNSPGHRIVLGTGVLSAAHKQVLDAKLWTRLMPGAPAAAAPKAGAPVKLKPHLGAAWRKSQAERLLRQLHSLTPGLTAMAAIPGTGRYKRSIQPIRRGIAIGAYNPPAKGTAAATAQAAQREPLASALDHIDRLIAPPGDSIEMLVDKLCPLVFTKEDESWRHLLSAYAPSHKQKAHELLHAVGLRPTQATVAWIRDRMRAASGDATIPSRPFGDAILDQLLFSAPHVSSRAAGAAALKDEQQADRTSVENRLAAMGSEYALHPLLGLAVDLVFTVSPSRQALQAYFTPTSTVGLCVHVGSSSAVSSPATIIGSDGWPKSRGGSAFDLRESGWCGMPNASLSNLETHTNLRKWTAALINARNRIVRAQASGVSTAQQVIPASSQTGPLTMHVDALATQNSKFVTDPTSMLDGGNPDALYLEDLVTGIRPILEVTGVDGHAFRRPLIARDLTYCDKEISDRRTIAIQLQGPDQSREEGQVSIVRLSDPGEKIDGGTSHLVATDQAFEWSGWNPAVPYPDAQATPASDLVRKKIEARPENNLPYRYGTKARVAFRWVLRDGSSRIDTLAAQTDERAPWVGDIGTTEDVEGFQVKRYEPLRAPMVLGLESPTSTPLVSDEAATRVILASTRDGRVVRGTSLRFVLPGAIRDIVDLDRHAVFDGGLAPTATAYPAFQRASGRNAIFATGMPFNGTEPVVRIGSAKQQIENDKLYHPDPLTNSLHFTLSREPRSAGTDPSTHYPIQGENVAMDVSLYKGRAWPDASAVRVIFEARQRGDTRPILRKKNEGAEIVDLIVGVAAGESFTLLIHPNGIRSVLERKHAFGSLSMDDPKLSHVAAIDVQHVLERPEPPLLSGIKPSARGPGERVAQLTMTAFVDVGSTTQVDLHASWTDPVDEPEQGLPKDNSGSSYAKSSMVVALLGKQIDFDDDAKLQDTQFNIPVRPPLQLDKPVSHALPDARYRRITYRLSAAGPTLLAERKLLVKGESQISDSILAEKVGILASHAPLPPSVKQVQLAFKFQRSSFLTYSSSSRTCAVSIVLDRGWWSSGPGELLAIAIAPIAGPIGKTSVAPSQWGADPIRRSHAPFGPWLKDSDFLDSDQRRYIERSSDRIVLRGHGIAAAIECPDADQAQKELVLYDPTFDAAADGWRVDVELALTDDQVQPFVQLVLARFQPHAIKGQSTSAAVVADFFQLPSKRSATVVFDPERSEMRVVVAGPVDVARATTLDSEGCRHGGSTQDPAASEGFQRAGVTEIRAVIQRAESTGIGSETWLDTDCQQVLGTDPSIPNVHKACIYIPPRELRGKVRVAIFEKDLFSTDPYDATSAPSSGPLHYFDILPTIMIDPELYVA